MASATLLLEAAACIQRQITEALQVLAAQSSGDIAVQRLPRIEAAVQRLKRVEDAIQALPFLDGRGARLADERDSTIAGASALTAAELRILPMLATHLSFAEIAAEIFVSPNTVKSQAVSIYRKLEASSRSQAVARSWELGLLEA